jgi:hypothetical protein
MRTLLITFTKPFTKNAPLDMKNYTELDAQS